MLLKGRKGIIMGVANKHSIARSVARFLSQQGAELIFSHLPDKPGSSRMSERVQSAIEDCQPKLLAPCDVSQDASIKDFFEKVSHVFDSIDFLVHSIAYAPTDDIRCPTLEVSRPGFQNAMDISVYSLLQISNQVAKLMKKGSSIVTMSYIGSEKVVPGYNLMGICKAALEASTRYLCYDLGKKGIRINAVSAGPIRTLAASAINQFTKMLEMNAQVTPLKTNISGDDVAQSVLYLLSDMSQNVTGEVLHVDSGFHAMAAGLYPDQSLVK